MDEVFRALDDASRRHLLDELFERDGQTLTELCGHLPKMSRHGVMNHLDVLADGGLVTTLRVGREKHHYLNVVPIRLVNDRWITKYTEPWAAGLVGLTNHLERGAPAMSKPTHVYEAYVRCSPEAAWNAIVDGDQTVRYFYGTRVESDWEPGGLIRYLSADGTVVADGEIVSIDEPAKVEMTFHPHWDPDLDAAGPVRTAWSVEAANGCTKVRVEYFELDPGSKTYRDFVEGIPFIVSGMKTLLETGAPIATG